MSMPRPAPRAPLATVAALLAFAALLGASARAGAEWLVLRDGLRLEIRGEPRVEKRRVVFTRSDGTLSALPLAEVDLDATAAANLPPPEPEPPAPAPPRAPIVRLTDADFDRGDDFAQPTILLFTAAVSPWCEEARKALRASGARYEELDVEHDAEAARVLLLIDPQGRVPLIFFEGHVVLGFSREALDLLIEKWRAAEAAAVAAEDASLRPPERHAAPPP